MGPRLLQVWAAIPTFAKDVDAHWREFVCLEAANAGPDLVELAPGASHTLQQTITVTATP